MSNESRARTRVFVSYSRHDGIALAEELVIALKVIGYEGYLDQHDIAAAEDWELRLDELIRHADTIVFILTPGSLRSNHCNWEVSRALELSKRIVPVLSAPVLDDAVPKALRRLNYIDFTSGQSFARSLGQLADTLRLDIEWIREHTRIGELAQRWHDRGRPEALLLRDDELMSAQGWMSRWQAGSPQLTELQRGFIATSVETQAARENLERQRNESMSRANMERAEALAHKEEAVQSLKRRTLLGGICVSSLSLDLGGTALWTLELKRRTEEAERHTLDHAVQAEAMRKDLAGQVIAYSTSPGQLASDRSIYSSNLLNELSRPSVSLWAALSRTSMRVMQQSSETQRPFISSDMNGDLYLRHASPTRKSKAVVIGVGRYEKLDLQFGGAFGFPGVYKDIWAWADFLRENHYDVTELRDPTLKIMRATILGLHLAAAESDGSALIKGGFVLGSDPPKPPADTLMLIVYSGVGLLIGGDRYLCATDTEFSTAQSAAESGVSAAELEQIARNRAAASVLIYDTQFQDIRFALM